MCDKFGNTRSSLLQTLSVLICLHRNDWLALSSAGSFRRWSRCLLVFHKTRSEQCLLQTWKRSHFYLTPDCKCSHWLCVIFIFKIFSHLSRIGTTASADQYAHPILLLLLGGHREWHLPYVLPPMASSLFQERILRKRLSDNMGSMLVSLYDQLFPPVHLCGHHGYVWAESNGQKHEH